MWVIHHMITKYAVANAYSVNVNIIHISNKYQKFESEYARFFQEFCFFTTSSMLSDNYETHFWADILANRSIGIFVAQVLVFRAISLLSLGLYEVKYSTRYWLCLELEFIAWKSRMIAMAICYSRIAENFGLFAKVTR